MAEKIKMTLKKGFSVGEPYVLHTMRGENTYYIHWGYIDMCINQPQMSLWEYGVWSFLVRGWEYGRTGMSFGYMWREKWNLISWRRDDTGREGGEVVL